jgi:hypothetical protein
MPYMAQRRLYVNADRTKVVPEDSPEAAFLLAPEGDEVDDETAERLQLKRRKMEPEDKARKAENATKEG